MANKDQAKGTAKQVEGKVEEATGKVTGDQSLENKGKGKQAEGKVQKKAGDVKEDVKEGIDKVA